MTEKVRTYNTYIQAILLTIAAGGGLATLLTGLFLFLSEWRNFPSKVEANTLELSSLKQQLATMASVGRRYDVIDLLPSGISVLTKEVKAGEPIWIAFYSKANIDCDRNIRVRFLNEEDRSFHLEERVDRAVKSVVSTEHQLLIIPIRTFPDMKPGTYRYGPVVEPVDCGVYGQQVLPLSESFRVVE